MADTTNPYCHYYFPCKREQAKHGESRTILGSYVGQTSKAIDSLAAANSVLTADSPAWYHYPTPAPVAGTKSFGVANINYDHESQGGIGILAPELLQGQPLFGGDVVQSSSSGFPSDF
eukprot:TRINITY_DN60079_c0_g1_i1.p2 TRINITY_DN60079_c0_g1~~TRINITY_DN60079_c0_g1_i1.p2  ORF type:complete len:118 (-),score=14.99 TRINITY_DN60079_c0_g1_i1:108-461(-)